MNTFNELAHQGLVEVDEETYTGLAFWSFGVGYASEYYHHITFDRVDDDGVEITFGSETYSNSYNSWGRSTYWTGYACQLSGSWDEMPDAIHGLIPSTYLADEVLELVNSATFDVLDDDAGLDRRAAQGIIDTRPLADLQELDDVSYMGVSAFSKLKTYVQANAS